MLLLVNALGGNLILRNWKCREMRVLMVGGVSVGDGFVPTLRRFEAQNACGLIDFDSK